jgi:hypothetical protein
LGLKESVALLDSKVAERESGMNDKVYLLWFVQERDDCEDCELLIGVYSSEPEAKAAIERVKGQRGFASFPEGFQIHAYQLDRDHWTEGFIVD